MWSYRWRLQASRQCQRQKRLITKRHVVNYDNSSRLGNTKPGGIVGTLSIDLNFPLLGALHFIVEPYIVEHYMVELLLRIVRTSVSPVRVCSRIYLKKLMEFLIKCLFLPFYSPKLRLTFIVSVVLKRRWQRYEITKTDVTLVSQFVMLLAAVCTQSALHYFSHYCSVLSVKWKH